MRIDSPTIVGNLSSAYSATFATITILPLSAAVDYTGLTLSGSNSQSLFQSITNATPGVSASADISVYNDTGNYLDMGIASSTYNGNLYGPKFNIVGAGDSYVYTTAHNLVLGTTLSSNTYTNDIVMFTGGSLSGSSGNERMRITTAGNVGIGTIAPISTSILELSSTTKGFLPPRLSTTQRDAITTPADGLVVYNSTQGTLNTYNGTLSTWQSLLPVPSSLVIPISSGGTSSTTAAGARTALDVPSLTLANSFAGVQSFPNQVLASGSNALILANLGSISHYTRSLFSSCTPSTGGTGAVSRRTAANGVLDGDIGTGSLSGAYYNIRIANTLDSAYDAGSVDFRHPWSLMFRLLLNMPANVQILFELGCAGGLNSVPTGGINAGLIFDSNTSCRLWRCNSTAPVYSLSGSLSAANIPTGYLLATEQFVWIDNDGVGNLAAYAASRTLASSMPYKPTTPICSLTGVPLSNSDAYNGINVRLRANGVPAAYAAMGLKDVKFTEL